MRIKISGVHVTTGEAIERHATQKADELATLFDQITTVEVTLQDLPHGNSHSNLYAVEMNVHATGIDLRGEGHGIDYYAAMDDATAKLVRQLQKYKGRLEKHRERRAKHKTQMRSLAALQMESAHVSEEQLDGVPTHLFDEFAPAIVRKEVSTLAPMTLDEAVMQMDLLHRPAFLFLNASTGQLNMVHRDAGNTVRWVAPKVA
jgi:putative sigma-54 modulation protein